MPTPQEHPCSTRMEIRILCCNMGPCFPSGFLQSAIFPLYQNHYGWMVSLFDQSSIKYSKWLWVKCSSIIQSWQYGLYCMLLLTVKHEIRCGYEKRKEDSICRLFFQFVQCLCMGRSIKLIACDVSWKPLNAT